jgi:D-alanyl-D-alanine carboxypeptidase/D-alanyl-D-alanine-endopeptidase (penicillin-binding protein 4)
MDQDPAFTGEVLAEVASPPLAELLRPMLVDSDNLIAETVARWLDPAPTGRSFDGAEPVIRDVLRRAGVADEAVVLADGSGLSRYGLVSAEALYRLFRWAPRQSWGPLWMELLPAAGRDGTLARRMAGGPAEGRARGKTGSMTGVFNLVAYVPGPDGDVVVVLLSNGVVARREAARTTQDIAVERVAAELADPPRRRRR